MVVSNHVAIRDSWLGIDCNTFSRRIFYIAIKCDYLQSLVPCSINKLKRHEDGHQKPMPAKLPQILRQDVQHFWSRTPRCWFHETCQCSCLCISPVELYVSHISWRRSSQVHNLRINFDETVTSLRRQRSVKNYIQSLSDVVVASKIDQKSRPSFDGTATSLRCHRLVENYD